ncbi:hypothetical protein [Streptomyces asiaticus]|uniref:hypothetical protein n=1 Tax=Streptomyces asiaticus TaxID=114695 RepID=UPI001FE59E24|nr:hypothetical protein [Streptomyces asiaticus]
MRIVVLAGVTVAATRAALALPARGEAPTATGGLPRRTATLVRRRPLVLAGAAAVTAPAIAVPFVVMSLGGAKTGTRPPRHRAERQPPRASSATPARPTRAPC